MWCQFYFVSGNAVFRSPHVPLLFLCCQLQKYSSNPEPSHFHFEVVNIPCINFFLKKKMTCKCAYKLLLMISAKKLIFLILFVLYVALNGKILQSSRECSLLHCLYLIIFVFIKVLFTPYRHFLVTCIMFQHSQLSLAKLVRELKGMEVRHFLHYSLHVLSVFQ